MDFLRKPFSYISGFFHTAGEQNVEKEVYLDKLFSILSWSSVHDTLKVLFCINSFFWLILVFNLKTYGVLALALLCAFVYDMMYREKLHAEYNGDYLSLIKDLKSSFFNVITMMKRVRKESSFVFTSFMVLYFLVLRVIASRISGVCLSYIIFWASFLIPLGFKILPVDIRLKIRQFIKAVSTPTGLLSEDELIPFIQGKDFSRRDPELESLLTDHTADSVTNSLISGISTMPSYLDVADAPYVIEEDSLLPSVQAPGITPSPGDLSSDSDSENKQIQFDSDHFNTSSSEDDPYSKDLTFTKDSTDNAKSAGFRTMVNNLVTSVSGSLMTNIIQVASSSKPTVRDSLSDSEDSEFEIIENEEITDDKN